MMVPTEVKILSSCYINVSKLKKRNWLSLGLEFETKQFQIIENFIISIPGNGPACIAKYTVRSDD